MRKIWFLSIAAIVLSFTCFAQSQPKTVTDFYLAFPAELYSTDIEGRKISGKSALEKFRRSMIKIEDVKNGYLKIEGAWEGWAEIALFKKKTGGYLVAQAETGCGPACDGFIKFMTYERGKWTDVTAEVFPDLSEERIKRAFTNKRVDAEENGLSHYFRLPRRGTTVKMACNLCGNDGSDDPDFILLEFVWDGEKFSVKE